MIRTEKNSKERNRPEKYRTQIEENGTDKKGTEMNALEIGTKRAEQFDKLEETSINILQDYMDGKRQGGDDVVTARCVLNVIKGNRQTLTARDALRFNMATVFADEPKALKRYVKATQPEIKKLMEPKK